MDNTPKCYMYKVNLHVVIECSCLIHFVMVTVWEDSLCQLAEVCFPYIFLNYLSGDTGMCSKLNIVDHL